MVIQYLAKIIRKTINFLTPKNNQLLTFIPHQGCEIDGYNIFNYKSDSTLTFFHYIITKYGNKYKYQVATGENEKAFLQQIAIERYPNIDIKMISHPALNRGFFSSCKELFRSVYIFSSQALPLAYLTQTQKVYCLGYYSGNFKNDFVELHQHHKNLYEKKQTAFFSTSFLYSQLNSIVYNCSLSKFIITGLARNDNLLKPYSCPALDNWIASNISYEATKVFLYTPTHRDYEKKSNSKRSILGFEFEKDTIEKYLKENKCVIIVKVHSNQNIESIRNDIPEGILLHKASNEYGLNELLQKADYLITDYTSTYFDFLLLDRPVLFNFYDFDLYQETRGFSFDPIDSILAGERFVDQDSMLSKMDLIMTKDNYKEKRLFVRNLIFKFIDAKASERVYNYIFNA